MFFKPGITRWLRAYADSRQVVVSSQWQVPASAPVKEFLDVCKLTPQDVQRCHKNVKSPKLVTVTWQTHLENLQLHSKIAMHQLHRRHKFSLWQGNCAWMDMSSSDVSSSFVHLVSHFLPFGNPACNLSEMRTAFSRNLCKALVYLWSYPFFGLSGAGVT